jgi:hypothetical protein
MSPDAAAASAAVPCAQDVAEVIAASAKADAVTRFLDIDMEQFPLVRDECIAAKSVAIGRTRFIL